MPTDPKLYPRGWKKISYQVRFELGDGTCDYCGAKHGQPNPKTGKPTIIMAAHSNHDVESEIKDLKVDFKRLCGRCHNFFDLPFRKSKAARNKLKKIGAYTLPFYDVVPPEK